ncbi:LrgB family protein [Dysosmobacter sp.]|jgi:predicted murein hydrolase (TIGR00659 family)|uniref:LrgB family protein n=1 Tax=Dysosmobacter sp. TaxID=2591382 RepID=UPI002A930A2C|nr:LrgB family protein [Dysosmobacter sp.]MCI6054173.1 LrgB family protein [Dysosmobacter sp.]MDY5509859.1 LrgB family protein [Dysosmobacter sp.]
MSALLESPFFGIALTVLAYWLGVQAQKRTGLVICNNMIVSVALLIAVLTLFHIPYEAYYEGGSVINMFLGPATACMAVTIYAKKDLLKRNWLPVLVGCLTGVVVSVGSILVMSRLFGLDAAMTASLLPKSVTTPIATAVSEGHGGIVSITVAAVIVTGILGNLTAPFLVKLFRVKDPVAVGLGIGACSHAMGTAKALEMGETEGAMSGLAIGMCGIITAVAALFFEALL